MQLLAVFELIRQGVRVLAAVMFGLAAIVALTHWAVRRGTLTPFGAWPRLIRRWGDPLLRPVERRLARAGGNPQDAPTWLLVGVLVAALVLIGLTDWLLGFTAELLFAMAHPQQGSGLIYLAVAVFNLLSAALMIRVFSSWFNISPHARWMRPVRWLTDWMLLPLQRLLPNFGPIDVSPLVAWFLLSFLRTAVLGALR